MLGASSDLGNSRNKENVKKNTNGNEDEKAEFPGESIAADKPMKKQKKAKAKKHVGSEEKDDPSRSSDDGGAERSKEKLHAADSTLCPKTRKKTDKKKRRPEAALGQDAAADVEPVASTGAKKAKKGNNNAGQADAVAIEDKDQQGPVHRYVMLLPIP